MANVFDTIPTDAPATAANVFDSISTGNVFDSIPTFDTSKLQRTLTGQPSQFGSGLLVGTNPANNPDADFLRAVTAPETGIVSEVGKGLQREGKALAGGMADIGEAAAGNPTFPNVRAAFTDQPMPMDSTAGESTPARIIEAGAKGLVESAPQMAAFAADPVLGVAAFGTTPEGFDPKQAAIAAVLPVVGKYSGAIAEAMASKAGVTSDLAKAALNKMGGATGATGLLGADQLHQIYQLPPDQRKNALIDAVGNVGSMFLLGTMGERHQFGKESEPTLPDATTAPADQRTATPEQTATPEAQPITAPQGEAPASSSANIFDTLPSDQVPDAGNMVDPTVRTPDGAVDQINTSLNKLRQESKEAESAQSAGLTAPAIGEQPPAAPPAELTAPATKADVVDLAAQMKKLQEQLSNPFKKPSESQPAEPAPVENSQPAAGTATPPAPVASDLKPVENQVAIPRPQDESGQPVSAPKNAPAVASETPAPAQSAFKPNQSDLDEQNALETVQEAVGLNKAQLARLTDLQKKNAGGIGAPSPGQSKESVSTPTQPQVAAPVNVARGLRARKVFDNVTQMAGPDVLSWMAENMRMMSKSEARATLGKDWWQKNQSLYDDAAPLKSPTHNVIYGGKSRPDQVAQAAYDARIIKSPDVSTLWDAIHTASEKRAGAYEQSRANDAAMQAEAQEHVNWQKATAQGEIRVTPDQLKVGDVMEVGGQRVKVKEVDPDTGDVTLQDGSTFGLQILRTGESIHVEKLDSAKYAAGDFAFDDQPSHNPKGTQAEQDARAAMLEKAKAKLTGKDLDTTKEMFGGESRTDKSGQQSMFAGGDQHGLSIEDATKAINKALGTKELPAGIIAGTEVESWADKIIAEGRKRLNTGLDPQLLSAYAVKGAALIERGVRNAAAWTKQMMADHGLTRDQALRVWIVSKRLLDKGRQTDTRKIIEMATGLDPESSAKPMTQKDVAAIQSKAAAQAFKAGAKAGAETVKNEPENITLKQRINQSAETQMPIEEGRTKAEALQDKLADSVAKSEALKEYYAGQERASATGAEAARRDLKMADNWSAADAYQIRKSLLDLVNTLPLSERGRFNSAITDAMQRPPLLSPNSDAMYKRASTVAARIMDRAEELHRDGVISDIRKAVDKAVKSPSVDVVYKSKILGVIRRVGLKSLSDAKESALKATRDYIARVGEQNTVPDAIVRQIDLLSKTPAKDLPINVLESIRDQVNLYDHLGRTMVRVRESLYNSERDALAKDMSGSTSHALNPALQTRSPGMELSLGDRIQQAAGNKIRSAWDFAKRTGRAITGRDVMLDVLDGDAGYKGALNRIIGGRLDADYKTEMNLRKTLHEPFENLTKELGSYSKNELERISIYAIDKEAGGTDRLKASGVLPETIKRINATLTPKEMAFYKTARKLFDEQVFPALKKFMRENYNVDVQPVENYWPFQRDHTLIDDDKKPTTPIEGKEGNAVGFQEMATPNQLLADLVPRRTTKTEQGMTIERLPEAQGAVKLNAAEVVNRHLNTFAHLISSQRNLKMIGELTRQDFFKQKYGTLGRDYVQSLLDTVARNSAPAGSTRTAWIDGLTKNTSVGIIGLRLLSQLKHLPNAAFSMKNVRWDYLVRGLVDSFTPEGKAFIQKNFAEIFNRFGGEPAIEDLMEGSGLRKAQAATFFVERALDSLNARATVLGRYMDEMAQRGIDPRNIYDAPVDKEAQRMALLISRQSVTSPLLKDQPQAITRGALTGNNMSYARALFQFQSTMLRQTAYLKHDIFDLGIKKLDAGQLTGATLAFLAMLYAETTIVQANKKLIGSQRPEKEKESVEHGIVIEGLKRVPFAGNAVSMAEYGETGVPIADTLIHGVRAAGKLIENKGDFGQKLSPREATKAKVDALTFGGEAAGVPGASTAGEIYKNRIMPPAKK